MLIARGDLLLRLTEASAGLSPQEVIEQSSCFVFTGEHLITFNNDIMVKMKNPLGFDAVVNAKDMINVLTTLPDVEVDIVRRDGEVVIKGKRRTAGIACANEATLPVDGVPDPDKWSVIADGTTTVMQQAAVTCGTDDSEFVMTCVHITPKLVEGCDNFRLLRVTNDTGFPGEVLLPASSIATLKDIQLNKVSLGKGWAHFKTATGVRISVACSHEKYPRDIDRVLEMSAKVTKVLLPSNLIEILSRAEVMATARFDTRVAVGIKEGEIAITARKDSGWYRERKKIKYNGPPLQFDINPQFLANILARTREVLLDPAKRRIKCEVGNTQFIVSLSQPEPKEDAEEE